MHASPCKPSRNPFGDVCSALGFSHRSAKVFAISQRAIAVVAAILTVTLATPAPCQRAKADAAAIRAARDQSNRAIAAHDVDGTVRAFLPEYVSVSSGNIRTIGRDAGRVSYAQIFANRPGVLFVRTPHTITVNAAWGQAGESGNWTGRWSSTDGLIRVGGEYFAKWTKVGGDWRLLAETFVQTTCSGGHYCDAPPVAADQPPGDSLDIGSNHASASKHSREITSRESAPSRDSNFASICTARQYPSVPNYQND